MQRTVSYRAVSRTYTDPHLGTYTAYAILGTHADGSAAAELEDFSADRTEAETFAARITAGQLDPLHLQDAACDFLYLQYAEG